MCKNNRIRVVRYACRSVVRPASNAIRNTQKGFLLIEVLVTISILAFGLVYISRSLTSCLNVMAQIASYSAALNLAEEKFFDVQMQKPPLKDESNNFSDNPGFRYLVKITNLQDSDLKDLKNADIQVSWKEGRRAGSFELSSYLPIKNE